MTSDAAPHGARGRATSRATMIRRALGGLIALSCALGALSLIPAGDAVAAGTGHNAPITFRLFPASNPWNADVSQLSVHPLSDTYLASIGLDTGLHPDFGTVWNGAPNGIPYVVVGRNCRRVPIWFSYADESDQGRYLLPRRPPIEGGNKSSGDRHVLVLDKDRKMLYELYDARYDAKRKRWRAGSGAKWDLRTNCVRPDGWTSADAAGLPMLPGLVRYDEVRRGEITHALRFTVDRTQRAFLFPATHFASWSSDPTLPPMGLRVRLRADYPLEGFSRPVRIILTALKKYGMIVADNGASWFISGAPDPRWNDDALHEIKQVKGSDFEVVDTRALDPAKPLVRVGRATTIKVRQSIRRQGWFTDPRGDSWTVRVDYGDGSKRRTLAFAGDKRFRLTHKYQKRGRFRVRVWVTNGDGATGSRSFVVNVRRR